MLGLLKNNILKSSKILCLEVDVSSQGFVYNVAEIIFGKNGVSIISEQNGFKDLNEIFKVYKKKRPVLVTITGKPVILRIIKNDSEEIVNQVVPGARSRDFYSQIISSGDNFLAAVGRKSTIDEIINKLLALDLKIIDCCLGGINCVLLGQVLKADFHTKHTLWSFNESNDIKHIQKNTIDENEFYKVGEESIASTTLVNFAFGLNYYTKNLPITEVEIPFIPKAKQDLLFGNLQKVLIIVFALFLAGTVGYNSILMNDYRSKNEILLGKNSQATEQSLMLENKKSELINKRKILESTGLSLRSKISFYSDRIGAVTPNSIQFDNMTVFPMTRRVKGNQEINFKRNNISIEGTSASSFSLNDWIKVLKNYNWIEKVKILKFEKQLADKRGNFKILISLK